MEGNDLRRKSHAVKFTLKLSEEQIVKRLKALEKGWPPGLWLFATGNSIHLMRQHQDGSRHRKDFRHSGMDPSLKVGSFRISNEGGDW